MSRFCIIYNSALVPEFGFSHKFGVMVLSCMSTDDGVRAQMQLAIKTVPISWVWVYDWLGEGCEYLYLKMHSIFLQEHMEIKQQAYMHSYLPWSWSYL